MEKAKIIDLINTIHHDINNFIQNCDDDSLYQSKNGKWSKSEEIGHLIKSLERTNKGLSVPKFILKFKFGTNNRAEKTYDEVVNKYNLKLSQISIPNNPFQLSQALNINKKELLKQYKRQQIKFEKLIKKFNEKELSNLLLPHPLLGKLTIREFVFFTHFHTSHHFENIKK